MRSTYSRAASSTRRADPTSSLVPDMSSFRSSCDEEPGQGGPWEDDEPGDYSDPGEFDAGDLSDGGCDAAW